MCISVWWIIIQNTQHNSVPQKAPSKLLLPSALLQVNNYSELHHYRSGLAVFELYINGVSYVLFCNQLFSVEVKSTRFIHVIACSRGLFFSLLCNIPLHKYTTVCFLVDGHLGCLLLWAIISNTAQTFHTYFGRQIHSFVLAISRSRIAGSQGICFDLADIAKTFHQRVVQMFTPIRSVRMLQLLHILLMFGIVSLFHCNHSYGV